MDWLAWVAGAVLLVIICASSSGGGSKTLPKKYRRSDLVIGRDGDSAGYCVFCCSEGFKIVFRGSLAECEEFMANAT